MICGDFNFNVHKASWLKSSHTSTAGTTVWDFCESRRLHQLIHFPTRQDAMLDLIQSEHTGKVTWLPNLNNSDYVAIFLSLAISYYSAVMPPRCHVFHWSHVPWKKLSWYFSSIKWNFHGSVDISTCFANIIHSATVKFIPLCIPKCYRPTPWWNHFCEATWWHKITCWQRNDTVDFTQVTLAATPSTVRRSGIIALGYKKISSDIQLVGAGGHWLRVWQDPTQPADLWPHLHANLLLILLPNCLNCPIHHQFPHFKIIIFHYFLNFDLNKVSHVQRVLFFLDTTKSIGDDNVNRRVLKSCASVNLWLLSFEKYVILLHFPLLGR